MNNDLTNKSENSIVIERLSTNGNDQNGIVLHGKFDLEYETSGLLVRGSEVLNHIILVATRSGNYQSVTPFKDVIVFEDDVRESDSGCGGVFNINLFNKILFDGPGDYYILCSIGSVTSNILHVEHY